MSSAIKNYFPCPRERFRRGIRFERHLACLPGRFFWVFLMCL